MTENININGSKLLAFLRPEDEKFDGPKFKVSGDGIAQPKEEEYESEALAKRADAKKRAMKIITDTLDSELKLDDSLRDIQEQNKKLLENIKNELYAAKSDEEHLAELEKIFGADPDSEEAKESVNNTYESMREHEKNATDYEAQFRANTAGLRAAAIERLKSSPMTDATKEAEILSKAADEAFIGNLMNEAREHIDNELEEKQEAAEKEKEKQDELDEKIEKAKLKREEVELQAKIKQAENSDDVNPEAHIEQLRHENATNDEILNDIIDPATAQNKINAEIEKMLDELKLLHQEIAGAMIDKRV